MQRELLCLFIWSNQVRGSSEVQSANPAERRKKINVCEQQEFLLHMSIKKKKKSQNNMSKTDRMLSSIICYTCGRSFLDDVNTHNLLDHLYFFSQLPSNQSANPTDFFQSIPRMLPPLCPPTLVQAIISSLLDGAGAS